MPLAATRLEKHPLFRAAAAAWRYRKSHLRIGTPLNAVSPPPPPCWRRGDCASKEHAHAHVRCSATPTAVLLLRTDHGAGRAKRLTPHCWQRHDRFRDCAMLCHRRRSCSRRCSNPIAEDSSAVPPESSCTRSYTPTDLRPHHTHARRRCGGQCSMPDLSTVMLGRRGIHNLQRRQACERHLLRGPGGWRGPVL
jgi:hypothetical protein